MGVFEKTSQLIILKVISSTDFEIAINLLLTGPTGAGKTTICKKLIYHAQEIITPPPSEIIYCYAIWQPMYQNEMKGVRFHEGVLDVSTLPSDGKHRLIILDDLQTEVSGTHGGNSSPSSTDLFIKLSHHMNLSVIFLVQELFSKMKQHRTLSLNTHYMWILKNPRDSSVIMHLAKQISPYNTQYVIQSYMDATKLPYSYLFIDMKIDTDDRYRLRGDFLSESLPPSIYVKQ